MRQAYGCQFLMSTLILVIGIASVATADNIDLSKAAIAVLGAASETAADMLADEIQYRTELRLTTERGLSSDAGPQIVLGTLQELAAAEFQPPTNLAIERNADGYAIWTVSGGKKPQVCLGGVDQRGALFAAGRLLRVLAMGKGHIAIDGDFQIATAPKFSLRGHQVGYRGTPNSYDAWDLNTYEQYVRDQVIFGGNCVEFTPSLDSNEERGRHMIKSAWAMTGDLIQLLDRYGIDSWIWQEIPNDVDVSVPKVADEHLAQWRNLLERFEGLEGIFVPGGDGGLTPAPVLMPFLSRLASLIHEVRPGATLWVSNQTFENEENDYLFNYLSTEKPAWLAGVVYGPWTKMGPVDMRERTPARYPVRLYADITHSVRAQYPVPDWDRAFAHGLNREAPNPRPQDMYQIFRRYAGESGDSITYSEGVNDDLNKFIWTALGWDPATPLDSILHDYGKVFFGDNQADAVARGLLMLEENWRGPIATNNGLPGTLELWKNISHDALGGIEHNWRLQMYLMRAYYDAYLQKKVACEAVAETEALAKLQTARSVGVDAAIAGAREALAAIDRNPPAREERKEIEALCAMLFKSIGMQLSVDAPYYASGPERGAVLDTLDFPLNNRRWLEKEFREIAALGTQAEQFTRIDRVAGWEDPGPGGFYDDLGNPEKQPHLVHPMAWADDPGYIDSPQCEYSFGVDKLTRAPSDDRLSWLDQASTLYKCPLKMHYDGLDPKAKYRLRVTYAGRFHATMRLTADGTTSIHDWMPQPENCVPVEFTLPAATTADGVLDLEWQVPQDKARELWHRPVNRGCQVAEVWLIRE